MANLVVDVGNSRTKLAVFNDRELTFSQAYTQLTHEILEQVLSKYDVQHSILSAVTAYDEELETLLKSRTSFIRFSFRLAAGIQLNYKTPETLGLDRLAAVIAAHAMHPTESCLVIDAGTCITYDAVGSDGVYSGGSIAPGLSMRLKAMHTFTGKLPLLEVDGDFNEWIGSDTRSSMLSGALEGALLEVLGFVGQYKTKYKNLRVVLCGGDADFFDTRLKNSIFAHSVKTEPYLVLIGLNEVIHHYND